MFYYITNIRNNKKYLIIFQSISDKKTPRRVCDQTNELSYHTNFINLIYVCKLHILE